ncbi:MAG: L-seryl-tRNA(Sec) selenium transferase, partial [Pseudomonadota bacterium]
MQEILRRLPQVDSLLEEPEIRRLIEELPRRLVVKAVRETLEAVRRAIMTEPDRQAWPEITRPALVSRI